MADSWLRLDDMDNRLKRAVGYILKEGKARLEAEKRSLTLHNPAVQIGSWAQGLAYLKNNLIAAVKQEIRGSQNTLTILDSKIADMNPLAILKRGYSITRKLPDMSIIKDSAQVSPGDTISVLLSRGSISGVVKDTKKGD